MKTRKLDFYERNLGKAVNLFSERATFSGDISDYDRDRGVVVLINNIQRRYFLDGNSCFVESSGETEIDVHIINMRENSTREDRLGRIANYNRDLLIEEAKKRKKVKNLENITSTPKDN